MKRVPLEKLMDLKVDFAFKQLFGVEKNKDITIAFLNAILQRTRQDQIEDISFKNTEIGGEYEGDKQSRLDLLVKTEEDEWINIEIQFNNKYDMVKRSIYYWSGIYQSPMKSGMSYKNLHTVIAINILNFNLFDETDQFHTTFHLAEDKEKFQLTDIMEFHFIEMSKLINDWKDNKLDPWSDLLARWLLLLGMVDRRRGKVYEDIKEELEVIAMEDKTLNAAFKKWDEISATQEQRLAYESRMKRIYDEAAIVPEMEQRLEEKYVKKYEKRMQETLLNHKEEVEKAKQEIEKSKKEAEKAKETVARNLLASGMDIASIVKVTGIEKERIAEIDRN